MPKSVEQILLLRRLGGGEGGSGQTKLRCDTGSAGWGNNLSDKPIPIQVFWDVYAISATYRRFEEKQRYYLQGVAHVFLHST